MSSSSLNSTWCLTRILGHEVFKCHDTRALGVPEQAQQQLMWPCLNAIASTKAAAYGGSRHALGARLRLCPLAKYDGALVQANEHDGFAFYGVRDAPTMSKWFAMVRLVYLVMLTVQAEFEDSCAVRDDLRKAYEKCNDNSQESRALIACIKNKVVKKDRKLYLSMYGKTAQQEKQIGAKSA
ncbi:hypothetical protein Tco_1192237 [Tanacetum coccineum]